MNNGDSLALRLYTRVCCVDLAGPSQYLLSLVTRFLRKSFMMLYDAPLALSTVCVLSE